MSKLDVANIVFSRNILKLSLLQKQKFQ